MWECNYAGEPLDIRLLVLRFLRKSPVILLAAFLGAVCIGGAYFLKKVTFGPAKEYEAVTDFYIDYAVQENGEEYTYFNQTTWTQLITDDVFTDKILTHMSEMELSAEGDDLQEVSSQGGGNDSQEVSSQGAGNNSREVFSQNAEADDSQAADSRDVEGWSGSLLDAEKTAGITKQELRGYLYATMLSDTRIVTTTITTNDPELTMKIEKALLQAMEDFGREQKEIAEVRILQKPAEAALVIADVRTFRACMLGMVIFVFITVLYLLIYFVLDDGIFVPAAFERRYKVPMLGTVNSGELLILTKKLFSEEGTFCEPVLVTADEGVILEHVKKTLAESGVKTVVDENINGILFKLYHGISEDGGPMKPEKEIDTQTERLAEECFEAAGNKKLLLAVKAGAHNGKRIEKFLDFCKKCDLDVTAALLWEADEMLIRAYEMPEHVLYAWSRKGRNIGGKKKLS